MNGKRFNPGESPRLGLVFVLAATGSICGGLLSGRIIRRIGPARVIWFAVLVFGLPQLLAALSEPGWGVILFPVGYAAAFFSATVYAVAQISYRQAVCPPALMGRVSAVNRWIMWARRPSGRGRSPGCRPAGPAGQRLVEQQQHLVQHVHGGLRGQGQQDRVPAVRVTAGQVLRGQPTAQPGEEPALLGRQNRQVKRVRVFPVVASALDPSWSRRLEQIGPMTAGLSIQATTGLRSLPLTPRQGLGVLALWATGALALRLRDA